MSLADDRRAATRFGHSVAPLRTSELDRLRSRLRDAEAEIERLRNGDPVRPASWQQPGGQQGGGGGDAGGGGGNLASKSQNPISDLVSLPLQNNFDIGFDPENRTRYIGNLQPVIPVKLNEDWNLINRLIVPIVNAPIGDDVRSDGLGDSLAQFFFSPRDSGEIIWGVGPNVLLPTATDATLGAQEWGAGVNAVMLTIQGPVVTGVLVSQVWSFDGATKPFLVQPFFNYNLPKGWFLLFGGEVNADWELPSDRRWNIPVGGGIGRVCSIFGQPVNINARFAPYVEKAPGGPDWQFRFQFTYLFPK